MDNDLALLHEKVDTLIGFMEAQQRQQQAFDELKADMIPIANHMIKLTIDELAEIGTEFRSEDLFFLLKRLLRNTDLLIKLTDQLESVMGLANESSILGKQVFQQAVLQLDEMEHKGYFRFGSEGLNILEKMVTEFGAEGLHELGGNIVPLLQVAQNAAGALAEPANGGQPPSTLALLRQLNDPQVRVGLAKLLNVLKSLALEPAV